MAKREKAERTKRTLGNALVELAGEVSLGKVTVSAVAKRAGVDRQTFYYHFDTLDDLIGYVCDSWISQLADTAAKQKDLRSMFHAAVQFAVESKEVLLPLMEGLGRLPLREAFYDEIHGLFESRAREMIERQHCRVPERELMFTLVYCQYASVFLILDLITGNEIESFAPNEMADRLNSTFERQINSLCERYR